MRKELARKIEKIVRIVVVSIFILIVGVQIADELNLLYGINVNLISLFLALAVIVGILIRLIFEDMSK